MPLLPFPVYAPDVVDYQSQTSLTITGVVPRADGYGPVPAPVVYSAALAGTCRGAFVAWKQDGTVNIFAGTDQKLYLLDNSTLLWSDVSKAAGTYTQLLGTDQWTFAQFGNYVIACQANTTPQFYDLGTPTTFLDLSAASGALGTAPNAKYISIVGRFVVLTGLTTGSGSVAGANPYRVAWSGLNAPATWDGTNSSDFQDLPDGGAVRGVAGGESGIILQDSAIRKMTFTQDVTLVFQIERVSQDKGLYGPYTLTRAGEVNFFLTSQGLHRVAPGELPVEVGKAKFNRTLMNDIDRANLQLAIGAADPRQSRILLAYKSASNSTAFYDKLLCYDYLLDRASIIPLMGEYLFATAQPGLTLDSVAFNALFPSIDAMTVSLDSITNALTPELAHFDTSHRLNFFRGTPLEATLDTAEQGTDGQRLRVRGFRPITDATTTYGSLVSRETVQAASTTTTETLVNAIGVCPQNLSTRYARGRIRIPAGTTWTYAVGVEPDFSLEGLR